MPARAALMDRPPVYLLRAAGKHEQRAVHGTTIIASLSHRVKRFLFQIRPERPGFDSGGRPETNVADDIIRTRGLAKNQAFISGPAGKVGIDKLVGDVLNLDRRFVFLGIIAKRS